MEISAHELVRSTFCRVPGCPDDSIGLGYCRRHLPVSRPEAHGSHDRPWTVGTAKTLTARHVEVLTLVAEGLPNHEIATKLDVTEETVKSHLQQILRRLDARNRCAAVAIGFRVGYLDQYPDHPAGRCSHVHPRR